MAVSGVKMGTSTALLMGTNCEASSAHALVVCKAHTVPHKKKRNCENYLLMSQQRVHCLQESIQPTQSGESNESTGSYHIQSHASGTHMQVDAVVASHAGNNM